MFFKIVLLQIVLLSAYHALIGAQSILLALRDKLYHLLETYNSCVQLKEEDASKRSIWDFNDLRSYRYERKQIYY